MKRRLDFVFLALAGIPVGLLAVGMCALHAVQVKRSAGLLLTQAEEAKEKGDTGQALTNLERYLGMRPDDADAAAEFAMLLADQATNPDGLMRAFLALEQALRLDPDRDDVRREAVEVAMRPGVGRFRDAIAHLKALLAEKSEDAELLDLMGQALEGNKNYEEAAASYREAIEQAPHRVETYVRLAQLQRGRLDDPEGADRVMGAREGDEGLVAENPESARAYLERGLYRSRYGIAGADEDIARAMELAPDDPDVLLASADRALAAGEREAASHRLERAREAAPDDPRVYLMMARIESEANHPERAIEVLQKGIDALDEEDRDGNAQLRWVLAGVQIDTGQVQEANRLIEELRASLRSGLVEFLEGRLQMAAGQWRAAITPLEIARTALANQPELTYQIDILLGACFERLGSLDRRLAAYRRAVAVDPVTIQGRLGLAAALADLGRTGEAIAAYQPLTDQVPVLRLEVARLTLNRELSKPEGQRNWSGVDRALAAAESEQPGSAEVALLRARALLARGDLDAARDLLAKAVQEDPENTALHTSLAGLIGLARDDTAAMAELDELEQRLGDTVASRLARVSYWAARGGDEAIEALNRLGDGADAFSPDERASLLSGLITARRTVGDEEGAARLINRLIELRPDDPVPKIYQMELAALRDPDASRVEVVEGVGRLLTGPSIDNLPTLLRLFDLVLAIEDESLAGRTLERIRSLEGDEGATWRAAEARLLTLEADGRAPGADRQARLARARLLLDEAAKRRPGWALMPLALARVEALDGDDAAALRALEQAKELGVRDPAILLNLYQRYIAAGRVEQADALLAEMRGLEVGAGDETFAKLVAESSLRTATPEQALAEARRAVSADSDDFRDHLWLASFLAAADQAAEAEAELRRAIALAPAEPAPRIALVGFLAGADREEDAVKEIEAAKAALPAAAAPLALARCYATVGKVEQAERQYEAAIAVDPGDPAPIRAAAEYALTSNRADRAMELLDRLAKLGAGASNDADWARRTLALVMAASGDPTKRRQALDRLAAGGPDNDRTSVAEIRARAQVLALQVDQKSRQEAIRLLEQIIDREASGTIDDRFLLAQLLEVEDQWGRARERMIALLAEEGDNPNLVARYIGWLLMPAPSRSRQPDADAAKPWIDRLRTLVPDAPQTAEATARYLVAKGQADRAVVSLEAWAQSHPDQLAFAARLVEEFSSPSRAVPLYRLLVTRSKEPAALLLLAGALERQGEGQLSEAEATYRRYIEEADAPEASLVLAGFFARTGRLDQALRVCDEAWADCPPDAVASAALELVYRHPTPDARLDRLARSIEAAMAEHPDSLALPFQLGNLRILQDRSDEAEALFRRSIAKAPNESGPRNNLAWFLAFQGPGRASEALELADRAIADSGPQPILLDTRALAYLQLDRPDQAAADLREAISKVQEPDPLWYVHLAQAHLRAGRRDEAVNALDRARDGGLDEASIPPLERAAYRDLIGRLDDRS